MSMHISLLSVSPVAATRETRPVAPRQAEARENISSYLPWNRSSGGNRAVDIVTTARELEDISYTFNRKLKFVVDYESQEVIVKVIDGETDKVIKILPPEELQRLHGRIRETFGFLFDQMV